MSIQVKEKRILFVAPDPNAGGSTKAILPVLKDLHLHGYKLMIMMPYEGYFSQSLQSIGIAYKVNPYINLCLWPATRNLNDLCLYVPRLFFNLFKSFIAYRKTLKAVEKFKPTLIYSNSSLVLPGYIAAKKYQIPHIWHVHEYGDKDFGYVNFPSNKLKMKRLAETSSISITKQIYNHYHLDKHGVVIYSGIKNISQSKINNTNTNTISLKKFILFVGHITKMKGVTDLIDAFVQYCEQGGKLNLILCGRIKDNYKESLLTKISHTLIAERISFAGQVDNVDIYMSQAEVLIVPSKYEAFGLVTSEAMFNRCLIVGRNTGGTKEQLDLGLEQTGHEIGLRFNTVDELTARMHEVESMNQSVRNSYILPAYQTAINNFTIENYTTHVREYIEQVIEKDTSHLDTV